jgi:hypothetical protein
MRLRLRNNKLMLDDRYFLTTNSLYNPEDLFLINE